MIINDKIILSVVPSFHGKMLTAPPWPLGYSAKHGPMGEGTEFADRNLKRSRSAQIQTNFKIQNVLLKTYLLSCSVYNAIPKITSVLSYDNSQRHKFRLKSDDI